MTNYQSPNTPKNNDEIDLFELCITLWKNKYTIIGITSFFTIITFIITFFVIKPVYQSEIVIAPPFQYQIDSLNNNVRITQTKAGETPPPSLKTVDPSSLYQVLITNLFSTNSQRQLFKNFYLPNYKTELTDTNADFETFKKTLSIKAINKDQNIYSISFLSTDKSEAYGLVKQFLSQANTNAKDIILKNRQAEINTLVTNFENSINTLKEELITKNTYELAVLHNAYEIAEKLDIKYPQENIVEPYMQGTEVISNKIKFLSKKDTVFSSHQQYNELTVNLNAYKNLQLPSIDNFNVYSIDADAFIPEKPIKPNKKIIVLIGFFLGGIFAVIFILIRQAIKNRIAQMTTTNLEKH